jgi:hypothetical protein
MVRYLPGLRRLQRRTRLPHERRAGGLTTAEATMRRQQSQSNVNAGLP